MKTLFPIILIALFTNPLAFAQAGLPIPVQEDLLRNRVLEAVKTHNDQAALAAIEEYRALEVRGAKIPVPLLFLEATLAGKRADNVRAARALESYLASAGRDDPNYQEALRRYNALSSDPAVVSARLATEQLAATAAAKAKTAAAEALAQQNQEQEEAALKARRLTECQEVVREYRSAKSQRKIELLQQWGNALSWEGCTNLGFVAPF